MKARTCGFDGWKENKLEKTYNRTLAHDVKTFNLEDNFKVPTFNRVKNE